MPTFGEVLKCIFSDLYIFVFLRQLEKERNDLVRTKNDMSLDLERLLNQKEVSLWYSCEFQNQRT